MSCELRTLTRGDFENWFGHPPSNTLRGVVGIVDGVIVGIGGVVYEDHIAKAFMELRPEARRYKRDIIRGARWVVEMMEREHKLVYAVAQDQENAPVFLKHFGFKPVESSLGEVYQWRS